MWTKNELEKIGKLYQDLPEEYLEDFDFFEKLDFVIKFLIF